MSSDNGVNPMQWNCETRGCFNIKKRPKIERFADCLPRRLAFSDVDGLAEVAGNYLYLEWKEHTSLSSGQAILFRRLTTTCPAAVLIVEGDAEHMTVDSIRLVWQGTIHEPEPATLDELRASIRHWAAWAEAHPRSQRNWGAKEDVTSNVKSPTLASCT